MTPSKKIWSDGKFVDWDKAHAHVLTHGLHYGTSVFEGIRCYSTPDGPAVFRINEHVERLLFSAKSLGMNIKFSADDLREAIKKCIKINNLSDCYIRPIAYFNHDKLGLLPEPDSVNISVACWPWVLKEGADRGVKIKISKYIRPHPDSSVIEAKIGGHYVNSVLASKEATKHGFDEALLLDHKGFVAEGPGENVFMIKNNKLLTPSKGNILPGITRETIMILAKDMGLEVKEKKIKPTELKSADEAFFTGTAIEMWPILKIDDSVVGDGKIGALTASLMGEYKKAVKDTKGRHRDWLTLI